MPKVKILSVYHKPYRLIKSDIIVPIHAGRSIAFEKSKDGVISKEDYKKQILLCSFGATVKNNLMWSHYANSHTGFCIEYDLRKMDKESQFLHALYPIIYSKNHFYLISKLVFILIRLKICLIGYDKDCFE